MLNISGFGNDATVEFEHEDGQFDQVEANSNGDVEFDTTGWSTGEITASDGQGANETFTLREQTIGTFDFASDSVISSTNNLSIDSNRANYNVSISADGLSGEELDEIFNESGATTFVNDSSHTGSDSVVVTGESDVVANFTGIDAGDYTFTAEVVDTGVTATTNLTVQDSADVDIQFGSESISEQVGDEVEFDLETTGESDEYWLNVTDDGGYYSATLNVTDLDYSEDETATVTWNTHEAAQVGEDLGFSIDEGNISVERASGAAIEADSHLIDETATFEFESFTQDPTTEQGEYRDVMITQLSSRSTVDLTVWTAPSSVTPGDLNTTELVDASTETSTIAEDDWVITQVEASGIYGYFNSTPANFSDVGNLSYELSQQTSGPYASAQSWNMSELGGNATIVEDAENDRFFVLVDASNVGLETGSSYDANFTVGEGNPYADSDQERSGSFDYAERSFDFTGNVSDGVLTVPASSDAEITGDTNVAPGTSIDVRMNFPLDFATTSGEVAEDGTFSAEANLSVRDSGTEFTTRASVNNGPTENIDSVIGGAVDDGNDTPGDDNDTDENDTPAGSANFTLEAEGPSDVTVGDNAQLGYSIDNIGDASGTVEYTVMVGGEEVDSGSAELDEGSSTGALTYSFDTSSAGDVEWSIEADDESASGSFSISEEQEPSDPNGTDGDTNDSDTDGNDSDDGDGGGQPGFGLVVALFALIGAALLALRRQN